MLATIEVLQQRMVPLFIDTKQITNRLQNQMIFYFLRHQSDKIAMKVRILSENMPNKNTRNDNTIACSLFEPARKKYVLRYLARAFVT